jgi:hypothetical protein
MRQVDCVHLLPLLAFFNESIGDNSTELIGEGTGCPFPKPLPCPEGFS